ncbi:hypothetical protein [Micromonospora sp. NPDC047740]|uniref:hypothetical protein n=1 Tax=Micromonospora sp. NPDC047740 TaxID=3364254 RepID=UPI003711DCA2
MAAMAALAAVTGHGGNVSRASEALAEQERQWRRALRVVSLACELDVPDDEVRATLHNLGKVYRDLGGRERRILLSDRLPACVVVALSGIGAIEYRQGTYWSAVSEHMGRRLDYADQKLLAGAFRAALDRFGMARFPNFSRVNVDEILMHSGVPLSYLADFLNALLRQQAQDPDVLTPQEVMEWATARGWESRLHDLCKPLQNLLRHGGAYVEDLVDRCLELLDRLREPMFVADGLQLPESLVRKAVGLAESGALNLSVVRQTGAGLGTRPRLLLEAYGRGLTAWLPPIPDTPTGEVTWDVVIGGEPQRVRSRSFFPGTMDTAPAATVPLSQPVRQVEVSLRGYDLSLVLPVVDPDDPLMVFTDEGRRVPASADLPPTSVWLMYPAGRDGSELVEFVGSPVYGNEPPAPYGWEQWRLRQVNLAEVSRLRLDDRPWRKVEGGRRPKLEVASPLPHVCSALDAPVWAAAPLLLLPGDRGMTTGWTVRVRRPGSAHVLSVRDVQVDEDTRIDPWVDVKRPLVGAYEVTARGPLGRGVSQTLELAEGLTTSWTPAWRELTQTGLKPCTVTLSTADPELRVTPTAVRLTSDEPHASFVVRAHGEECAVKVTPPHLAIQTTSTGARAEWSVHPLRLDTETAGQMRLMVRLPAEMRADLVVFDGARPVQRVPSSAKAPPGVARFELARVAETVQQLGTAELRVDLQGLRFPVARCLPRSLATSVWVDDDSGRVVVEGGAVAEGLTAGIYLPSAPWREPYIVAVGEDFRTPPLPEVVTSAGNLVVHLRIEDPWIPQEWPRWPEASNTFVIECRTWRDTGGDSDEAALSRYLASAGPLPTSPAVVKLAFDLYQRADDVKGIGIHVDLRAAAARLLAADPCVAFASILDERLSSSVTVAPLVSSGLMMLPRQRYLCDDDEIALWGLSPAAAAVASAHRLGAMTVRSVLYERIATVCGVQVVDALLMADQDPHGGVGAFGAEAEQLAAMKPDQLNALWSLTPAVPGGLLEGDERWSAARELFDARLRTGVVSLADKAERRLRLLMRSLEHVGGSELVAAVHAREQGPGWRSLPALSIALCLASRLAARGHEPLVTDMPRLVKSHAVLARHAPRLTAVDVVLAELLVTGLDL